MDKSITKIQSMYRAKVARALFAKRVKARETIRRNTLAYMLRRKWQREVESHAGKYLEIVIRI